MAPRLSRLFRIALTIICAAALQTMAHAQDKVRTVQLPWEGTDDEIVVNLAIGSLRGTMVKWLTSERGVHAETLLVSIGAIAGLAAQNAVQERIKNRDVPGAHKGMSGPELAKHLADNNLAVQVTAKSGDVYLYGDLVNGYLVQQSTTIGNSSLYAILGGAALQAGVKPGELPDARAIFRRVSQTIGTPEYGILNPPKPLDPHYTPRQALEKSWRGVKIIFERKDGQGIPFAKGRNVKPEYWPLVTALVARQFLLWTKDEIDPRVGFALILESAIAMSKLDPAKVAQGPAEAREPGAR